MKESNYTAFEGHRLFDRGALPEIALKVKKGIEKNPESSILIFNDNSGQQVDFDLSGSDRDVVSRLKVFISPKEEMPRKGPGRPKLGVVSREISLLPRHWEWLNSQPGGSSVTLRKLVDKARKKDDSQGSKKQSQNRTHGIITVLAGNLEGYEEALRYLYRNDEKKFKAIISKWPKDILAYVREASLNSFR